MGTDSKSITEKDSQKAELEGDLQTASFSRESSLPEEPSSFPVAPSPTQLQSRVKSGESKTFSGQKDPYSYACLCHIHRRSSWPCSDLAAAGLQRLEQILTSLKRWKRLE